MKRVIIAYLLALVACSGEEALDPGAPTIAFEREEYKIKKGETVTLAATIENAIAPAIAWRLEGKIIATGAACVFAGDLIGEYFITLRVDAENGAAERQLKVSVLERVPPEINMPSSILARVGKAITVKAEALYADAAAFLWRLDGEIVSREDTYIYTPSAPGAHALSLRVTTADGEDLRVFTITALPEGEAGLFFDDGRHREPSNVSETRAMTVPLGRPLVVAPVICNIASPGAFAWTVDGVAQPSTTEYLTFAPVAMGEYLIAVTEASTGATASLRITCTDAEGAHFRPAVAGNKATPATAFDYVPAPGQFINYQTGSTKARALQDLQTNLDNGGASMIGAYGGYWIVGFDHSVRNESGRADLLIPGNAFAGWSEPGIVWVMQDDNGNGLPDDTWYELKGSEAGKPETLSRHAITYYRPTATGADVLWTDNRGGSGTVDYNGFHSQAYYFPMFITGEYYTLTGTRLQPNFFMAGAIESARDLPWGYVDNYNTDPSRPIGHFYIEDAIQADGSPVALQYIDFVKVHTATTGKGSAVGEISTEPGCPADMNFTL
jgi:hypothetical protein